MIVSPVSRAATRGDWNEVWDNFDRRKAANDVPGGNGDEDMFARVGVAAE
jgi:ribonucleoside-diphosphate reductase beta chain